ncbi:hypothetical protein [Microbacterium indicum]|uniref:hypothetical protein n=1 Tax=Microbacterium indicum TaxID=358100 RepID=UPI0012EB1D30|nr:hypothetical protein [Microbacterium indicum]
MGAAVSALRVVAPVGCALVVAADNGVVPARGCHDSGLTGAPATEAAIRTVGDGLGCAYEYTLAYGSVEFAPAPPNLIPVALIIATFALVALIVVVIRERAFPSSGARALVWMTISHLRSRVSVLFRHIRPGGRVQMTRTHLTARRASCWEGWAGRLLPGRVRSHAKPGSS